jgi:DNA polymerase elongation subunit (family B)
MSQSIVFDIETYNPNQRQNLTRREAFDPARNNIITIGFFDGKNVSIFPTIRILEEEKNVIEFFLKKIDEFRDSILVGYNILHFDVPYLVHKTKTVNKDIDFFQFKPLDLFWVLPYWFHNIPSGRAFFNKHPYFGDLWKFENVVEHILKEKPNPVSNKDVHDLWEKKEYGKIEKHLEMDLLHTYLLLKSSAIQETLNHVQNQYIDKNNCSELCPFQQFIQKSSDRVSCYCTLQQEPVLDERILTAIDTIDFPLPRRGTSWIPHCLN